MVVPDSAESEAIRKSFANALDDDTDFVIKLECFTWHVHANAFIKKSGFFKKICQGNTWKESNERTVTLHDDEPAVFARVLQFMYYGVYSYDRYTRHGPLLERVITIDKLLSSTSTSHEASQRHLRAVSLLCIGGDAKVDLDVYDLADKYDMPSLKEYTLDQCFSNVLIGSYTPSKLFGQYYPARVDQDRKLKDLIASSIADQFEVLKANNEEWRNGAGKWLREDFELCTMVMEKLSDVKKSFAVLLEPKPVPACDWGYQRRS